jgi:hypothetical protein
MDADLLRISERPEGNTDPFYTKRPGNRRWKIKEWYIVKGNWANLQDLGEQQVQLEA